MTPVIVKMSLKNQYWEGNWNPRMTMRYLWKAKSLWKRTEEAKEVEEEDDHEDKDEDKQEAEEISLVDMAEAKDSSCYVFPCESQMSIKRHFLCHFGVWANKVNHVEGLNSFFKQVLSYQFYCGNIISWHLPSIFSYLFYFWALKTSYFKKVMKSFKHESFSLNTISSFQ